MDRHYFLGFIVLSLLGTAGINKPLMPFLDLPGEPSKLRVIDSTKSSITLGWEKPIYDGGSEITHYVLDQMNTEEREWITINPQVKACEYVVSHLKPGTYYFFRVSAVNCKGKGEDIKMYQPIQAKDILGLYIKVFITFSFF